ncbi:SOS response-associated peptidase [Paenibacillus albiflavus]|uniref:Abasic site processing protein n=1 Tax=Paenibacillus albiflavus TaxID=2545760 RepID=A0A4V2WPH7_9BACL|nr:SOS response-associated peptidase [Paenibacillus albiflavus]TCZ79392.1 SOS response-associated peptidase [Paenibacillus albiflavus]
MCGRYTITVTFEELMLRFYIDGGKAPYHGPRYNVAPGQAVPAIINDGQHNRLGELRWGLVPSWAKDERSAYQMINARSETLLEKPAYRIPLQRKRCLIPADGFYEWKKVGSGKQPMRMTLKNGELFAMAGLYDTWINPADGSKLSTCTIITTTPNKLMAEIHDRMPVIIRQEDEPLWLSRSAQPDVNALLGLLRPYPADEMIAYPVSTKVGNVRNDDPSLIEEFGMGTLF